MSPGADRTGAYYDVPGHGPVPLELNIGAGGDYIYLLYSRENNR
jgi:hypothetical protein